MYHPGGFGGGKDDPPLRSPKRSDPSVWKPIFFMVSFLFGWVFCFLVGINLGLGWYAWPFGSLMLASGFIVYVFFLYRDRKISGREN